MSGIIFASCEPLKSFASPLFTLAKTRATHRQLGIGSVAKKQIKTKITAKQNKTKTNNRQKIKN